MSPIDYLNRRVDELAREAGVRPNNLRIPATDGNWFGGVVLGPERVHE